MSYILDKFEDTVQDVYDDLAYDYDDEYYDEAEYGDDTRTDENLDTADAADDEPSTEFDETVPKAANTLQLDVKKKQKQARKSEKQAKTATAAAFIKKPIAAASKLTISQEEFDQLRDLATSKRKKQDKKKKTTAQLGSVNFQMLGCVKEHIKMNFDTAMVTKVIRAGANPAYMKECQEIGKTWSDFLFDNPTQNDYCAFLRTRVTAPRLKLQYHNITSADASRDSYFRAAMRKSFMASAELGGKVFLHGGESQGKVYSDLMCWDPQEHTLTVYDNSLVQLNEAESSFTTRQLPAASHHAMAVMENNLLIFAGAGHTHGRIFHHNSYNNVPFPANEMQISIVHKPHLEDQIQFGYPHQVATYIGCWKNNTHQSRHYFCAHNVMPDRCSAYLQREYLPRISDFSVVSYGYSVYIFGGRRNTDLGSSELYRLDFDQKNVWRYTLVQYTSSIPRYRDKPWPRARFGHSACLVGTQMVIFGGKTENTWFNDLWVFDIKTLEWREIEIADGYCVAPPLCHHQMFLKNSLTLYAYGGCNQNGSSDMLLRCDWQNIEGKIWSLSKTSSQPVELITEECVSASTVSANATRSSQLPIYGHSVIVSGSNAFSFGGLVDGNQVGQLFALRDAISDEGRPHLLGTYLKQALADGFLTDVIFRVMHEKDGQPVDISAHRCIISARCPVLNERIASVLALDSSTSKPIVEIYECHSKVFLAFLEFLYCGHFELSGTENIKDLVRVAQLWSPQTHGPILELICGGTSLLDLQVPVRTVLNQFDQDLSQLVLDARGHHSDVTLYLAHADVHVPAHKLILCRAPFFKQMFSSGFKESVEEIVTLEQETSDDVLMELIRFIYTNTVNLSPANVVGLLLLSTQFQVADLSAYCQIRIQSYLSLENVVQMLQISSFYYDGVVKSLCVRFILEHYDDVIASSPWIDLEPQLKKEIEDIYKRKKLQLEKNKAKRAAK